MSKLFEGFDEKVVHSQEEMSYHVISFDVLSACARVGQIFSDEDFAIHIISAKEV